MGTIEWNCGFKKKRDYGLTSVVLWVKMGGIVG